MTRNQHAREKRARPILSLVKLLIAVLGLLAVSTSAACQTTLTYVSTTKTASKDVVATATTFYMKWAHSINTAANSANWDMTKYLQGQLPYPTLVAPIDSAFYIQWGAAQQIASVYGDVHIGPGAKVDVFVSSTVTTLVRDDPRYLCKAGIIPNGVFNCPFTMRGTYLVFWPLSTEQPGNLVFREVRAWSWPDLASSGTVVVPSGTPATPSTGGSVTDLIGLKSASAINYACKFGTGGWFYIDLGAVKPISTVWVQLGLTNPTDTGALNEFCMGFDTTLPASGNKPQNVKRVVWAEADNEEYVLVETGTCGTGQYIELNLTKDNDCRKEPADSMFVRAVAAFAPAACATLTSATIVTTYPAQEYTGLALSIPWPEWTVVPAGCFWLQSLDFRDSNNVDLVLNGTILINWVLKTITYQRVPTGYDLNITMKGLFNSPTPFTTAAVTIPFLVPCFTTVMNAQTFTATNPYQIVFALPNIQTTLSFPMHTDTAGVTAVNNMKCGAKKYTTDQTWATIVAPAVPSTDSFQLQINTNTAALAGTRTIILTTTFVNTLYTATRTDNIVVTLYHPCKATVITTAQTISDISYSLCAPALLTPFLAFADTVSAAYSNPTMCGLVYSFTVPADATSFGTTISALNIQVSLTDTTKIGLTKGLVLQVVATPLQDTPGPTVPFNVIINHPCPASTLTFPSAISAVTIVSMSGTSSTVTFTPTTNSAETTLGSGYCGTRDYTIEEAQAQTFVTIVSPAPANVFTTNWQLTCLSGSIADVGVWTVTLKATLTDHPQVQATKTFSVTINHICSTTVIQSQTLTPPPYQISFPQSTAQTILTFSMNTDTVGNTNSNNMFCGIKKYTTNQDWLTVNIPADPLTQPLELQVTTNDYTKANTYSINLVVGFLVGLTQTITQTFSLTLLHPCVATIIQTSTTLTDMDYMVARVAMTQPFAFTDTAADAYNIPNLCALTYSLTDATDATTFGVSLVGSSIQVYTTNTGLLGQQVTLTLSAKATPLQTSPSPALTFTVRMIDDPCKTSVLTLLPLSDMTITSIDGLTIPQTFVPASDSYEDFILTPGFCGARVYTIVETIPKTFITIVAPATNVYTANWTANFKSNNLLTDVGVWTVKMRVTLSVYPLATPAEVVFKVTVLHICHTTAIQSQAMTPTAYQINFTITTPQMILSYLMHKDSMGISKTNAMICEIKTYTTNYSWLSVLPPANPLTTNFQLKVTTNDYNLAGSYTDVVITIGFARADLAHISLTQTLTVTLIHPCKLTTITTSQTITDIVHMFGDPLFSKTFLPYADSVATQYGVPSLCGLFYTLTLAVDATSYGVTVDTPTLTLSSLPTNYLLIGTSKTLVMKADSSTQLQTAASQTVSFKIIVTDPCPQTTIQLPFATIADMVYTVAEAASIQTFVLGTNSKSVLTSLPNLCGSYNYKIVQAYPWSLVVFATTPGEISIYTTLIANVGVYQATLEVSLVSYSTVAVVQFPFTITINNPCLATVVTFPTTPAAVTITAMSSGPGVTRTYAPAVDTVATAAGINNICGNRIYSIVEAIPAAFTTITAPAAPANLFTTNWTLTFKTNLLSVVGVYQVTLQAKLTDYTTVPAGKVTFTVTVLHICATTTITSQTITPIPYQIQYNITTPTIFSFPQHSDSISFSYSNPMICEVKTYTLSQPWLSVLVPSPLTNPASEPLKLQVNTNDYLLTGVYNITMTVGFSRSDLAMTLVQNFEVTLLHPCKVTLITTPQIMPPLDFMFGSPTTIMPFDDFQDTASQEYAVPGLCKLYYTISAAADALKFGITLGLNKIEFWTDDFSLINQFTPLTLTADADPQQDLPSTVLKLNATVTDPCPGSTIALPSLMTNREIISLNDTTVTWQSFKASTVAIEQATVITGLCGARQYTITDSSPGVPGNPMSFIKMDIPTDPLIGTYNMTFNSTKLTDVKKWSLTLTAQLVKYPGVKTTRTFQIWVHHPCEFTEILGQPLENMKFAMGFPQEVISQFMQFNDTISQNMTDPQLCQDRQYDLMDNIASSWLHLLEPADVWTEPFSLSLYTLDPSMVGNYTINYMVSLKNFPMVEPLITRFKVTIEFSANQFPYFSPKLLSTITVQMSNKPTTWKYPYPTIIDKDGDLVSVTGNFGAATFLQAKPLGLEVKDASALTPASYQCSLTLFDGKDKVQYFFTLKVVPPIAGADKEEKEETKLVVVAVQKVFDADAARLAAEKAAELERLRKERASWSPYPPNPFMRQMSEKGLVTIGFTSDVILQQNLTVFNNGTVYLSDLELLPPPLPPLKRDLRRDLRRKGEEKVPVLMVEVLPGSIETNATALTFWWEVSQQTPKEMNIQIYFDEPLKVSANPIPDKLRITFNDYGLLRGVNTKYMEKKTRVIEKNIPKQTWINAPVVPKLSQNAQAAAAAIQIATQFMMSGAAQQLMDMINSMQLVVLLPLFDIQLPAFASMFFAQLMKIAAFDIIDTAKYWDKWLNQTETDAFNENFNSLGFDSMWFMNNMGTMFLAYIVYFICIGLFFILQQLAVKCERCENRYESWRSNLFYNSIVAMIVESYSILSLCSLISLNHLVFDSYGDIIETAVALFFCAIVFFFPIFVTWFTCKKWEVIGDYKDYYSHFFEDLDMTSGPRVLLHNNWFMIRRLLMAAVCVFTPKLFFVQFTVFAWSSIANVVIVGQIRIFEDPAKTKFEMQSEVAIMLIMYTVICFSSYVSDVQARETMGYICCLIIALNFIFNLSGIIFGLIRAQINSCKMCRHRRMLSKQIKTNKEAFGRRKRLIKLHDENAMIEEVDFKEVVPVEEDGMALIDQLMGAENQRQLERAYLKNSLEAGPAVMEDMKALEQMVENHFADADMAIREIIDNRKAEKQQVAQELQTIARVVDDFFEAQDQQRMEKQVAKDIQNLESFVGLYFDRANQEARDIYEKPQTPTGEEFKIGDELNDLEKYVNEFFSSQEAHSRQNPALQSEIIKPDPGLMPEADDDANTVENNVEEETKTVIDIDLNADIEALYGTDMGKRVNAFGRLGRFSCTPENDDPLADEEKSSYLVTDESMRETLDDPFSATYQHIKFKNQNLNVATPKIEDEIQDGLFM